MSYVILPLPPYFIICFAPQNLKVESDHVWLFQHVGFGSFSIIRWFVHPCVNLISVHNKVSVRLKRWVLQNPNLYSLLASRDLPSSVVQHFCVCRDGKSRPTSWRSHKRRRYRRRDIAHLQSTDSLTKQQTYDDHLERGRPSNRFW